MQVGRYRAIAEVKVSELLSQDHPGASVRIPAGALVDLNGASVARPGIVYITWERRLYATFASELAAKTVFVEDEHLRARGKPAASG